MITVGAVDIGGDTPTGDDSNAPWSAYGYTVDGFAKPEVGAPGRYLNEWVPANTSLAAERPSAVIREGMELSGTSFAAPVVSGMAANLLGVHPDWTPDQVKGAIMRAATAIKKAAPLSVGVGEVDIQDGARRQDATAESERRAEPVPRARPRRRAYPRLRLGELAEGGEGQRVVEQRVLGQRVVEHGFVEHGVLEQRLVEHRFVPERVLEHRVLAEGACCRQCRERNGR